MKYQIINLEDVKQVIKENKFTVISTFVGGGGSSTGYRFRWKHTLCK